MVLSLEYLATWFSARHDLSDRGASLVEYVLLVSVITVVCLAALSYFGGQNNHGINRSSNSLVTAG